MVTIRVKTENSYDITISDKGIDSLCERLIEAYSGRKIALITDSNVDRLYGKTIFKRLKDADFRLVKYVLPAGESSKTLASYCDIINFLADNGMIRTDLVIALGGGVIGDISGFCAASYMRGIDYIQIPTTLLACVDSSIGGKTAVDLPSGKNLVGAFYQPKAVMIYTDLLKSLRKDIYADGVGEVLKYAIIRGGKLWEDIASKREIDINEMIAQCINIKRELVERDERDNGERRLLNLGHTFGHAIERLENYSISHGEAVSVGLRYAIEISHRLGILHVSPEKITKVLDSYEVKEAKYSLTQLVKYMELDKKKANGVINFVLVSDIGKCVIHPMTTAELLSASRTILIKNSKISGDITILPSKSYLHRSIIMASRASTITTIRGVVASNDVLETIDCITELGGRVEWLNSCDIRVSPIVQQKKAKLLIKESGSTLRFILPQITSIGVAGHIEYSRRLGNRNHSELIDTLVTKGARIKASDDCINVSGIISAGDYHIKGNISSQYISGLLMALSTLESDSNIYLTTQLESGSYIDITIEVMAMFGVKVTKLSQSLKDGHYGGYHIAGNQRIISKDDILIEGDWSNALPWLVLSAVSGGIRIHGLNHNSKQGDRIAVELLEKMGAKADIIDGVISFKATKLKAVIQDASDCPDTVPVMAIAMAMADGKSKIINVDRLRIKESDRVESVISTLKSLGIKAYYDNGIVIEGGEIGGGVIDCHNDHRIAMMAVVAGCLGRGDIILNGSQSIAKSYPDFYSLINSLGGNINVF